MPDKPAPKRARARAASAGKPTSNEAAPHAAVRPPTEAELDRRDQMKSGPRRQAGPPLKGDTAEPAPLAALAAAEMPEPTDPEGR